MVIFLKEMVTRVDFLNKFINTFECIFSKKNNFLLLCLGLADPMFLPVGLNQPDTVRVDIGRN